MTGLCILLPVYKKGDNISGTVELLFREHMESFTIHRLDVFIIGMSLCSQIDKVK